MPADEREQHIRSELDTLLEEKPYLAAESADNGGRQQRLVTQGARSGERGSGGGDPNEWLRQQAKKR